MTVQGFPASYFTVWKSIKKICIIKYHQDTLSPLNMLKMAKIEMFVEKQKNEEHNIIAVSL